MGVIRKDNQLIAEFMGVSILNNSWIHIQGRDTNYNRQVYPNSLKYNSSWEWLMPVLEKVVKIKGGMFLWNIEGFEVRNALLRLDKEEVFKWVVSFIKAYNQD